MKRVRPDYYDRFACIKGDCRHSCCIGWEIDIDEESIERFRAVPGVMGDRLRSAIFEGDEGAYFKMGADGRCPFLNGEGLCDLILGLGEECLCQICDDHPRFRNFFSDLEEAGLGLCCEAAGRLILSNHEPTKLLEEGAEALNEDETELLVFRNELISILQDRSKPVEMRAADMLEWAELELEINLRQWAEFLIRLEHLEEAWPQRLLALAAVQEIPQLPVAEESELAFEQLMVYLLYRHLPAALDDDDLAGHICYCALMWSIVRALVSLEGFSMDAMVEICREYSAEIEYSDENIEAILEELNR